MAHEHDKKERGWIGVDLDSTLAFYDHWRGADHIGEPIAPMMERVRAWIKEGREVRIFTARATIAEQTKPISAWLKKHKLFQKGGLKTLEITNVKDFRMDILYDDRAIQVRKNTGEIVT